jgi:uncharacterized membrane protein SpoIIM required for sporulation
MREAAFVQRNKEKWQRLEQVLAHSDRDLSADESSTLYIELTDDLSYARTFFPGAEVTRYLNELAVSMHQHVHRSQKTTSGRFITFWTEELPLLMARHRKEMLISSGVFFSACLIGALSAHYDDTFTRLIMGDGYVDMTLENIKNGKPMDVYGGEHEMDMFFGITLNNILVSISAFASGVIFSFGTWLALVRNGVMLGCFQYFMYQQGVLQESVLSIWIHGTIEISSIVIAGGAGIVMGNGLLFPGTYSRLSGFMRSAKDGLKIVIGLVPCFIIAGFLESFITRLSPRMYTAGSVSIIAVSLAFIVGYFIIYPYHVERRFRDAR